MSEKKVYRAIGLMSGTSLDGIDCALIETDGYEYVKPLAFLSEPYSDDLRDRLRACFGKQAAPDDVVRDLTLAHADIVKQMGEKAEVVGFHGQTILHNLKLNKTVQVGDGELLARETGIDVVCDFRSADVAAGGQGAPLVPVYHKALLTGADVDFPVVVLNIGGVANVTYIDENELIAFDTGPGNALMDDWVRARTGERFDKDGALAKRGKVDDVVLNHWLDHPYFKQPAPKSLDRDQWTIGMVEGFNTEDGAAMLMRFTAKSIIQSLKFMPDEPQGWYVCGGGRHNKALMEYLSKSLPVHSVDELGWNGDATEAECFAYLAVRSLIGEPISFPGTTGAPKAMSGGVVFKP